MDWKKIMPAFMDNEPKGKKKKSVDFSSFGSSIPSMDIDQVFVPDNLEVIKFAIQEGKALRFGLTSDGGALCIALYDGGQAKNFYVRSAEEIAQFFAALYQYCKGSV